MDVKKQKNEQTLILGVSILILGVFFTMLLLSYLQISQLVSDDDTLHDIDKGVLKIGANSGIQTITDSYERHLYKFDGEEGQIVEAHVVPLSNSYMSLEVYTEDYRETIKRGRADTLGIELGHELVLEFTLPYSATYLIIVDMTESDIGDYEITLK